MRQPTPRWQHWRLTRTPAAPAADRAGLPAPDAVARRMSPPPALPPAFPAVPAELKAEPPGPDGVRHGLVAHVRQLIADGAYDTPDRWAAAEAVLLRRIGG